jgi:hypothetical protein
LSVADCPSQLWRRQAESDRVAGSLLKAAGGMAACQVMAKHQQSVEKCVKWLAAAVAEAGLGRIPQKYYYRHQVGEIMSHLRRRHWREGDRDVWQKVHAMLGTLESEVDWLCGLAPRAPESGQIHGRNTEYPFELSQGSWDCPASEATFGPHELQRAEDLTHRLFAGTAEVVSALARQP